MKTGNIFSPAPGQKSENEYFETILSAPDLKIERIVGLRAFSEPGKWYDQEEDEWVILLQGEAELEFKEGEILHMKRGDYIFLPSHKVHRVKKTSGQPNCVWLAVFGKFK